MGCAESNKGFTDKCFAGFQEGPYREEEEQQPHLQLHHQDETLHLELEVMIHLLLFIINVYK